jgi:hypothetical protein
MVSSYNFWANCFGNANGGGLMRRVLQRDGFINSFLSWLITVICSANAIGQLVNSQEKTVSAPNQVLTAKPASSRDDLLAWLTRAEQILEKVDSYRCWLVSREEVGGKLGEPEKYYAKIRHSPFSVYLASAAPEEMKGQEAIYVEGQNSNKLLAHLPTASFTYSITGTVSLAPDSFLAMRNNRHPITCTGIKYIVDQAKWKTTGGLHDPNDATIKIYEDVKVHERPCTVFEIQYTTMRSDYDFRACRLYFDNELQIPTRYEAFGDAKEPGKLKLLEEYTYYSLELNSKLKDLDFSTSNPSYAFP